MRTILTAACLFAAATSASADVTRDTRVSPVRLVTVPVQECHRLAQTAYSPALVRYNISEKSLRAACGLRPAIAKAPTIQDDTFVIGVYR